MLEIALIKMPFLQLLSYKVFPSNYIHHFFDKLFLIQETSVVINLGGLPFFKKNNNYNPK